MNKKIQKTIALMLCTVIIVLTNMNYAKAEVLNNIDQEYTKVNNKILSSVVAVGANGLILSMYTNASVNLNNSKSKTAAIIVQREQGYNYWRAYLADYGGLGGITYTLTYEQAVELVKQNNMTVNVFTLEYGRAVAAVLGAYPGNGYVVPEAHRPNGKILNMQHIHAKTTSSGIHGKCHVFFATPVFDV